LNLGNLGARRSVRCGPLRPHSWPFSQRTRPPGLWESPRQNPRRRPSVPPRCPICRERSSKSTSVAAAKLLGLFERAVQSRRKVRVKVQYCATSERCRRNYGRERRPIFIAVSTDFQSRK